MFFVYIIESIPNGNYYIGQTEDLESRIKRHNAGRNKSTKSERPWKIVYWKECITRSEAYKVEQHLKSLKKRQGIIDYALKNKFRGVAQPG